MRAHHHAADADGRGHEDPRRQGPAVDAMGGLDRARAELKSRFLSQFAAEVIRTEHPELASKMFMQTAVLNWHSRDLEMVATD